METLERVLQEQAFFAEMPDRYLAVLAGCASNMRVEQGEHLCRQGQEAEKFFLIREGKSAVEISTPGHGVISLETLSSGDVVGWSWLIPPYASRFDVRATTPLHVLALDGKCLRHKCEADHDLGYELLKRFSHVVAQRLQATRMQLVEFDAAYRDLVEGAAPRTGLAA